PLREQTDEELRKQVAELRRKLPYQSVAPRLEYESLITKSNPRLSRATIERLDAMEKAYAGESGSQNVRTQSLSALHSDKVLEFMRQEGMGFSRMIRIEPGQSYPKPTRPDRLPVAKP